VSVLAAIWLLVIGYGLVYVGYQNQAGHPTSFKDAFLGGIDLGGKAEPAPSLNPIQATGSTPSNLVTQGARGA